MLSLCPPSQREMKPALPPHSTAPRARALRSAPSRPVVTQRSTAKSVLPPLMTMMSAAARAAATSDAGGVRTATSSALTTQPTSAKPDVWLCIGAGSSYVAVPR